MTQQTALGPAEGELHIKVTRANGRVEHHTGFIVAPDPDTDLSGWAMNRAVRHLLTTQQQERERYA